MDTHLQKPRLRWPIDLRMEQVQNEQVLLINCPLGISPQPLLLIPAVAPIISCMEGTLSIAEITDKFKTYGIQQPLVEQLVRLLDDHFFLAGPRFDGAQQSARQQFLALDVRPAALAGLSYARNAEELRREVGSYLTHGAAQQRIEKPLVGIVAPHIDYRRGAVAYGNTYTHLERDRAELYVVIGTSHQYSRHLFHLTRKHFASPLGTLRARRDAIDKLATRYGASRSFADEFLHRREHSLELQLPFLSFYRDAAEVLPILVGSFHHMLQGARLPNEFDEYESFAGALAETLKETINAGTRVCFVAGVDMAHVGRHFGDEKALTPEFMEQIAARDRIYLDTIMRQDSRALFQHVAEDLDARRICGFPTMYMVLDVLDRLGTRYDSRLFDYRQAIDYESDCAVTFAGLGLYH